MPHEAVEVEWRGGSGVGLDRAHLGQRQHGASDRLRHGVGGLDRGALGQVDDHRELGLVVEGQELDGDVLGVKERQRAERQSADDQQEQPAPRLAAQQRAGHGCVDAAEGTAFRVGVVRRGRGTAGNLQHQPGRDGDRDEEGEDHRGAGVGRDRAHVGAHHAGDEEHRQQRGDHGEGGDDGGVADLGHRLDRRLPAVAAVGHAPVAGDVLDDDDGVVDQDADREDQREERDPVQRVAHQPGGEERQQDRHRDDDRDHEGLAAADGEGDQRDDRDRWRGRGGRGARSPSRWRSRRSCG